MISWAEQTGPGTGCLVAGIPERQTHPEHGYRACLGVIRLGSRCGAERFGSAADYAVSVGATAARSRSE